MNTYMMLVIWGLLIVIAIFDLKENRIPNKYLLLIIFFTSMLKLTSQEAISTSFINGFLGASIMFSGALILHLIKALAPGDVKLLGCIGYLVGWGNLTTTSYWLVIASGMISALFGLFMVAGEGAIIRSKKDYYLSLFLGGSSNFFHGDTGGKLRMPLAPSVVVGLALSHYF